MNVIRWRPSTDPTVQTYVVQTGSSSSGTFATVLSTTASLSGNPYFSAPTQDFSYSHALGGSTTWYRLGYVDASANASYGDAFQAGADTIDSLTTVARVKEYMNRPDWDADALITRTIEATSDAVQTYCGRTFSQRVYVEDYDGDGGCYLKLRQEPITAVSSLVVDGQPIDPKLTWDGEGYVFGRDHLELSRGLRFGCGLRNVTVQYTAGHSPVPSDIEQAVIIWTALTLQERTWVGKQSDSAAGYSVSYLPSRMPDGVRQILDGHKRLF